MTAVDDRLIVHPDWCLTDLCEWFMQGAHIGVPMQVAAKQDDVIFSVSQGVYDAEETMTGSYPAVPLVVVTVENTAGCFETSKSYLSTADALELARTLLAAVVEAQR